MKISLSKEGTNGHQSACNSEIFLRNFEEQHNHDANNKHEIKIIYLLSYHTLSIQIMSGDLKFIIGLFYLCLHTVYRFYAFDCLFMNRF